MAALTSKLKKQPVTSHPSVREHLDKGKNPTLPLYSKLTYKRIDFEYAEDNVVVSGQLVTRYDILFMPNLASLTPYVSRTSPSRGPGAFSIFALKRLLISSPIGTSFAFALKVVELLLGKEKRDEVAKPMIFPTGSLDG